jgi:glutathione S-transferase
LQVYVGRKNPADASVQEWLGRQADRVKRGLAMLEAAPPTLQPAIEPLPHVGQITLACLLGYCDLRFDGAWRKDHPQLVAWLADFSAQVPAFEKTRAPG